MITGARYAPDGNRALCFRVTEAPAGWKLEERHASGGARFVRDIGIPAAVQHSPERKKKQPRQPSPPASPAARVETLSPDQLDAAYTKFIAKLSLLSLDRIELRRRGLSDVEIDRRQFCTMPGPGSRASLAAELALELGDEFVSVPGFGFKDEKPTIFGAAGIAIPVRNVAGQVVALIVRARKPSEHGKYTALSSKKHGGNSLGSPPHIPLGVTGPLDVLRVAEGHLKSDVIASLDSTPTISCGGVSNYRSGIGLAKELGAKTLRMAFDADASTNGEVARNLLAALQLAKAEGLGVELERWNIEDGKGLDDLLAAGKKPELLAGEEAMVAAIEIAKAAGVDPSSVSQPGEELVERVRTVLGDADKSAIFEDEDLLQEIAALQCTNRRLFSRIRAMVQQAKVPIKNFDFVIKKLAEAAAKEQPPELARDETGGYFEEDSCICRTKNTVDGPVTVQLCNFTACIVDETTRDDGAETRILLGIVGKLRGGRSLRRIEVPAEKFSELKWVVSEWGSDAIIFPNEFRALPAAIQLLSQSNRTDTSHPKQRRTVYEHTGLRNLNGRMVYLHAGGMISGIEDGTNKNASVELPPPLSEYRLPEPPTGEALVAAILASLKMLNLTHARITYPLLAAVFRAVLGPCDFSLSLVGSTGVGKSELAALTQQHFGAYFNARKLPAGWSSTDNANERLAFQAKDAVLVIDDFAPTGSTQDVNRYHRGAERIFRAQGNNIGRGRMRHDGTLRPPTPPRGLIISTGEDYCRSHSIRARQLMLEVVDGDINFKENSLLVELQQNAAAGLNAAALAGFLAWLLPKYDRIIAEQKRLVPEIRAQASSSRQHARTPGIVAELMFAFRLFLKFALHSRAITEDQRDLLKVQCWEALLAAADSQRSHQIASDPAKTFIGLLHSALGTCRVHLADFHTVGSPENPESRGWRRPPNSRHADEWEPQGQRIGWADGDNIYLDRDAAYGAMQKFAQEQGQSIPISCFKLCKMLKEQKLLATVDEDRGTNTVRHWIHGERRPVLHLLATARTTYDEDLPQSPQATDKLVGSDGDSALGQSQTHLGQVPGQDLNAQSPQEIAENKDQNNERGEGGDFEIGRDGVSKYEEYEFAS